MLAKPLTVGELRTREKMARKKYALKHGWVKTRPKNERIRGCSLDCYDSAYVNSEGKLVLGNLANYHNMLGTIEENYGP